VLEIDPERLDSLRRGVLPVTEPDLPEMWQRYWAEGTLSVTDDYRDGLRDADFVFIAVGTPSAGNGSPDLKWVRSASRSIAGAASGPAIVVIKSTVPVGTADIVASILERHSGNGSSFRVVSNPEFLREGLAVFDFMNPTRVVVGASDAEAADAVADLYATLDSPTIRCDNRTAEMSKYASNVFLASRISFINEISLLCDEMGVDVVKVAKVAGMEPRCGDGYLGAGLGWGGSCLPKDVRGLIHMAKASRVSVPLVRAVQRINQQQPQRAVEKLRRLIGSLDDKTIGVLGLSFKPESDDMREARSLKVIPILLAEGCRVRACDPLATPMATRLMPEVTYCSDAYEVAEGCDALVLVTEWDEFKELDMRRMASLMRRPAIVDGRNAYDPAELRKAGFVYDGMGRRGGQEEALADLKI
jgi:UDPglucose 6-dehydrogenase